MMKKLCFMMMIMGSLLTQAQDSLKVLFIGNSYTYVNDLPTLVSEIAAANGDYVYHDQNTIGGYTFQQHSTNATTLNKIASQPWDFVVLQEQSQLPSFPPSQVNTDCFPYATVLNDSILANDSCTETLFFMTWGHIDGDPSNCPYYSPLCTYLGMQFRLEESYLQMGTDNQASISPVGSAWRTVRNLTSDSINLYSTDGSHPNANGSYLAACVFYASMFHKSPVGNTFISTIPQATATFLQEIADQTVFDSIPTWNQQSAIFNYVINDTSVTFTGTENYESEIWDFGDGNQTITHNPIHSYYPGNYMVTHTINYPCSVDTATIQISIFPTYSENADSYQSKIVLYPNPTKGQINIISQDKIISNSVYSFAGQKIMIFKKKIIDLTSLPSGIYFIKIMTENGVVIKKINKI